MMILTAFGLIMILVVTFIAGWFAGLITAFSRVQTNLKEGLPADLYRRAWDMV